MNIQEINKKYEYIDSLDNLMYYLDEDDKIKLLALCFGKSLKYSNLTASEEDTIRSILKHGDDVLNTF
jgi:hypothetical protein